MSKHDEALNSNNLSMEVHSVPERHPFLFQTLCQESPDRSLKEASPAGLTEISQVGNSSKKEEKSIEDHWRLLHVREVAASIDPHVAHNSQQRHQ